MDISDKEKTCRNCGNSFTDRFCNHCGQEEFKRFNQNHLIQIVKADLFDIEHGLLLTFKELWVRPGELVLNYLNGARIKYYSPIKYLVFWTALYLLVIPFTTAPETNYSFQELVVNSHEIISLEGFGDFFKFWYKLMTEWTNIYFISVIPFLAGASYVINRAKNFNFMELLISQTYFCGQFASVAIFNTVLSKYINPTIFGPVRLTDILIQVPYWYLLIVMQGQLFKLSWKKAIWTSTLTVFSSLLFYLIFLFPIFLIIRLLLS